MKQQTCNLAAGANRESVSYHAGVVRLLIALVLAFKVWMYVDALRRRAETHWLWIIMMVPGGALLYLIMVRGRDPDAQVLKRQLMSSLTRPPSVEQLRHRLDDSPSIVNRLQYAQGLADAQRFDDAKGEFEQVLAARPSERDALFGKAVCEVELGAPDRAIEPLEAILEEAPTYREFAVYPELAEAYAATGRLDDAIALLRQLAKSHPRIRHVVLLAQYLTKAGEMSEASGELKRALRRYEDSPKHYRRQNRAWAREARRMLEA